MGHIIAENGGDASSFVLAWSKNLREFLHFFVGKP
jgi:hypothetical protein